MKTQLEEVHFLRAFGIIGIVLIHAFASRQITDNIIDKFINLNTSFVVPLFIFISGLVLSYSYKEDLKPFDFYKRRLSLILLPYLIFASLYYFYGLTNNYIPPSKINIGGFLSWVITAKTCYHLWFFATLFQFYFIFPFLMKLFNKLKNKWVAVLISTLIFQLTWNYLNVLLPRASLAFIFPQYIFYFIFGIYFAANYAYLINFINKINLYLLSTVYFTFLWIYHKYSLSLFLNPIIFTLTFWLLFRLSLYLKQKNNILIKFLNYIASLSLGIYLVHIFCLDFLRYALIRLNFPLNNYFFNDILFLSTLFLSILVCYLISYLPFSKYIIGTKR